MAWYDNFPNTKINYFLIPSFLIFGPLIYFYTKSVTTPNFKFTKKDIWHFVPQIIYTIVRLGIYFYDVNQPGFNDVQQGEAFNHAYMEYLGLVVNIAADISIVTYLAFSIQMYWTYKKKTANLFSDTFKLELRWLRNFLAIFSVLFIGMFILQEIDSDIVNLGYTDFWWIHLAAAISLIYLGIYGYFLDIKKLHFSAIEAGSEELAQEEYIPDEQLNKLLTSQQQQLRTLMETEKIYLNTGLTLSALAQEMNMNSSEISRIINTAEGMNFNDFINSYRVKAVKEAIQAGKADQYTLLAIAFESGFNSKATFNRTFKKFTQQSPSEFLRFASLQKNTDS